MKSGILTVIAAVLWCSYLGYGQERTVGTILNDSRTAEGYVLFTPLGGNTTYLVDTQGRLVHSWTSERQVQMAYLHETGLLYRIVRLQTPSRFNQGNPGAGRIECVGWDGTLHWAFDYRSDSAVLHHDLALSPDGNVFFIAWEHIPAADALAAGMDPSFVGDGVWPDAIIEIEPDGNGSAHIVWEWHTWDHIIQYRDPTLPHYGNPAEHVGRVDVNAPVTRDEGLVLEDWQHSNGLDYNASLDQLVLSGRHTNEIWVIDHSYPTEETRGAAGDILYRWGNPAMYAVEGPRQLYNQHDPQWIGSGLPGEGNILVFNNGTNVSELQRAWSTVDEIAPPLEGDGTYFRAQGEAFGPLAPVWRYEANPQSLFYSRVVSGAQRMPNGNTCATLGLYGEIVEVTPNGTMVWRYINPVSSGGILQQGDSARNNALFKARKYPSDFPAFTGRDLTPGIRIEDTPVGVARIPGAASGHILSSVYPNPFTSSLQLRLAESSSPIKVAVYDITGRLVAELHSGRILETGMSLTWNGRSNGGFEVPSGVYNLVVYTSRGIESRRIVKW